MLLPGTVAYLAPILIASGGAADGWRHWLGLPFIGAGSLLLVWCARDFHVRGRGTLAPWDPPRSLVRTGPYSVSRNPMYVAVLTVVIGWAIWFRSGPLVIYAVALAVAFDLRIRLYEEPRLRRGFADEWREYEAAVPRWVRFRPSRSSRPIRS